jgi:hypothetical protein
VIYHETWGSTQSCVAFFALEFCPCLFVYGGTHSEPNSLTFHKPVSCLVSGHFSWLVYGACLPCLAVRSQGALPVSSIRFLINNVSLNCWYGNFEPQEVRMLKLLRMVRSVRWKNSFFVYFQVSLLIRVRVCHAVRSVHVSCVSVIV